MSRERLPRKRKKQAKKRWMWEENSGPVIYHPVRAPDGRILGWDVRERKKGGWR